MIAQFIRVFLQYFVCPGVTWATAFYVIFDLAGNRDQVESSLSQGAVLLLILSAYAYQTGYKGFYRVGRKGYFFAVFVAPIVAGVIGLLACLIPEAGFIG